MILLSFQGRQSVKQIRNRLLPNIIESINQRFDSFEDDVFQSMVIVYQHRWDHENSNYWINEINSLANHLSEPLKF